MKSNRGNKNIVTKTVRINEKTDLEIKELKNRLTKFNRSSSENDVIRICLEYGMKILQDKVRKDLEDDKIKKIAKELKELRFKDISNENILKFYELYKNHNYRKTSQIMNIPISEGTKIVNLLKEYKVISLNKKRQTEFLKTTDELKKILMKRNEEKKEI